MDKIALPPGLPVGFRFHPTDEELITCYLKPKLLGTDPDVDRVIAEVDFYNFDPWELPDKSKIESKDRMWLFFCRRDYQNTNSKRVKRTTKTGFWKITGKERVIKDQVTRACIGKKRTLVFHRGSAASGRVERTDWVVHEYFVESDHNFLDQSPHVLCRLKIKGNDMADTPDGNGGEPHGDDITVENPVALDPNPWAHGMVQTTNPALGAEEFDDRFAPSSNEEVIQMLQSQPLYSPPHYGIPDLERCMRVGGQAQGMVQTTNPALDAEGFDDPFAPSNEEPLYQKLRSKPLYSPPRYGFPGEEISLPPSVGFFRNLRQKQEYNGVSGQRKQGLNSSAISFEDDVELTANLIPKKKEFFPRMITSLKRCFYFFFYSRTSPEKNSTVG